MGDSDKTHTGVGAEGAPPCRSLRLSVVIPVYNGAQTLGPLVQALKAELDPKFGLEIVLVNDGSPDDNSAEVCTDIAAHDLRVKFINLARNFGEHNAVMAGLNYSTGEAVVVMDDDCQNPPSEVIRLVEALNQGYDVVYSSYARKEDSLVRNLGSRFNNLAACILLHKPTNLYLSSFKAMNRFLVDELVKYTGPYPYVDGLILRTTRNYHSILVKHNPRMEGRSGYTFHKLISLWLNMFTNFSILPLRAATYLGFAFALAGLAGAVSVILDRLDHPNLPAGHDSIIVVLLIISAVQLIAIGMVGEYLGRLFLKNNGDPQFIVRRTINCTR
jgi:glycosyltransferase involved in cell wall biosynthesis